jgi:hypothetical protein
MNIFQESTISGWPKWANFCLLDECLIIAVCRKITPNSMATFTKIKVMHAQKIVWGHISGDSFINSSGHPVNLGFFYRKVDSCVFYWFKSSMPCLLISILDRVCFNAFTSKNSRKELNKSPLRQMFNLALWAHECSKQQHCTKHIALHTDLQRTESRPKLTRFIAATLFRPIVEHHVRRRAGSTGRRCRRRPAPST